MEQNTGQGQHLLLATGHRHGTLALAVGQIREEVEHVGDAPFHVSLVGPMDVGAHDQVLADGHVAEHALASRQLLNAESGPQLGRRVGDRAAVQSHHAPLGDA